MLAVTAALPDPPTSLRAGGPAGLPPIVLVHGAANSAAVWTHWQRALAARGWASYAIDLRGHGRSDHIDLSHTSMADYAADVRSVLDGLGRAPVVMGWSMGGLVAMIVALAPSAPAPVVDATKALRAGTFGAEKYGIAAGDPEALDGPMPDLSDDERQLALASLGPESRYARDERARGIVAETLPCRLLIVTGAADEQWPAARYAGLALAHDRIEVAGASHWGLVLSGRALKAAVPAVVRWLESAVQPA